MSAVTYRLRSAFVRRWPAMLALSLVVAAVVGAVLACAVGARRTATAPDRFTAAAGGDFDAMVTQQTGGPPLTKAVAALPGVASAASITFVFGGLVPPGSSDGAPADALLFSGTSAALPARIVEGREPDPDVAGEFVATPDFVAATGASIGDVFHVVSLSQEQADANGFDSPNPAGPQLDATLVGVIERASPVAVDGPEALMSPALLDLPDLGISQTLIAVRLRPGVDLAALRTQLDTLPGAESLAIGSGAVIDATIRRAVRTQAIALWLLTAVAAAAAVVVLGLLVSRFARITDAERDRLVHIGYTERLILLESCGRAAIPLLAGAVLAVGLAVLPSGAFPNGFARKLEPAPGIAVDAGLLILGAAAMALVVAIWVVVALAVGGRPTRRQAGPSAFEAVASRGPSAVVSTGVRFAFGRPTSARSRVAGLVLAIAATVALLIGAVEFGVSLHRLLDEPFRYGVKHDLALGDDGSRSLPEGLQQTVEADPDVAAMVLYASNFAHAGRVDVQLLGMDVIRGDGAPTVVRGRLPSANDEIALGRSTAHDTGVGVGGSVELQGPAATRSFRVVGIAVIPGFGANEGVGSGGLVTMAGLQTLDPAAAPNVIAVGFDRTRPGGIERLAAQLGLQRQDPWRPAVIVNASRVSDVPFVLAGLVSALCLLTVVTAAIGSVRCRQREFAILRALGAGGRWVTMAIGWQATLLATVPAVAGAVTGAVLGQQVFARFADGIGAIDDAAMPLRAVLLVVLGLVVVANVAVLLPGRSLRRVAPAMRLHAE